MRASDRVAAGHSRLSIARSRPVLLAVLVLAGALPGCASQPPDTLAISALPPLQLEGRSVTVAEVDTRTAGPDLLVLDEPMREFVARYTANLGNRQQRLMSLHRAVSGAGILDIQYDPFADGSAQEVFYRGSANCLSYANLFVALARQAGLDARYQWLDVRPQWSRVGERLQVGLHVNVLVRMRDGKRYVVDIDPLPGRDVTGARDLSDEEGEALYYNNLAMDALANENLVQAWSLLVRALRLSPDMSHLWVNLGAIYRYSGQNREAEQSYLQALELDVTEYPAMTNLAVLYGLEGRGQQRDYWLDRVERHRQANPYYHAWQGDEAAAGGDWATALTHYDRAVELSSGDSQLLFARGLVHYRLNDFDAAALDMEQAIELATRRADIESYQLQLEAVRRAQLVGL